MVPAGFMYKKPLEAPPWVGAPAGARVYSLSGCVSEFFTDYTPHWRHNGFWLFDSPAILDSVAESANLDPADFDLLYYELHPEEYVEGTSSWQPLAPDPGFPTKVLPPEASRPLGFDVTCFSCRTSPECSPLVCCGLASQIAVNGSCLLDTLSAARDALESGVFDRSEPGPFRIVAVNLVRAASPMESAAAGVHG